MKRTHRHKVKFPIFQNFTIHVVFTDDWRAEAVKLNADLTDDSIAWTVSEGKAAHIIFPHHPDPDVVAHETFHAIWALMKFAGAEMEEEVVAYHLGHVVELITKWSKTNAA